ncbi:hypothetical protein ACFQ36_02235 [Arthrobacter sp. GCM10027362]|uniref:hypothetical protein n=1 Tax=Arthrobacter sp. GCM10027362 TaxID=3273379 RepID=UPI00362D217E
MRGLPDSLEPTIDAADIEALAEGLAGVDDIRPVLDEDDSDRGLDTERLVIVDDDRDPALDGQALSEV